MVSAFRRTGKLIFGAVASVVASEGAFYISDKLGVARHLDISGNSISAVGAQAGFELFDRVFGREKGEPKVEAGARLASAALGGAELKALDVLLTEGLRSYVRRVPDGAGGVLGWGRDRFEQVIDARAALGRRVANPAAAGGVMDRANTLLRYALTAGAGIAGAEAGRPVQSLLANMKRAGIG